MKIISVTSLPLFWLGFEWVYIVLFHSSDISYNPLCLLLSCLFMDSLRFFFRSELRIGDPGSNSVITANSPKLQIAVSEKTGSGLL